MTRGGLRTATPRAAHSPGLQVFTENSLEYEIIVVEDNSPDNTREAAFELQRLYGKSKIQVLPREGKLGLGSAYIDGLKLVTGEMVFIMDADMSHHVR